MHSFKFMTRENHAQIIALIISFLLIMSSGVILIVGTATAQDDRTTSPPEESDDSTEESTENGESDDQGTDTNTDEQTYDYVFPSENLRIVNEHWEGDTYVATLEAVNRAERVTVTDAGRDLSGGVTVDREGYTVGTSGTTEIRFTVVDDRAVTIDDGRKLYGHSPETSGFSAPDVHTIVSAAIGLLTAFTLMYEFARRKGKLSKRRVVKA